MERWDQMPWSQFFFFECWVISQLFHPRQMSHPGRLACPDHTAASSLITWDQQPCTRGQLGPPLPSTTLACKITSINSLTTQGLDTIVTSTSFWGALMQIDWFTSSRSHSWKRAECNRKQFLPCDYALLSQPAVLWTWEPFPRVTQTIWLE